MKGQSPTATTVSSLVREARAGFIGDDTISRHRDDIKEVLANNDFMTQATILFGLRNTETEAGRQWIVQLAGHMANQWNKISNSHHSWILDVFGVLLENEKLPETVFSEMTAEAIKPIIASLETCHDARENEQQSKKLLIFFKKLALHLIADNVQDKDCRATRKKREHPKI